MWIGRFFLARDTLFEHLLELDWRGELLTFSLILAESAIAYLFLGLLIPTLNTPYQPFPAWLIFALFITGYYVPHLLDLGRVWGARYETILTVALIVSFVVAVKIASFPDASLFSSSWLHGMLHGLIMRPTTSARPVWAIVIVVAYTWWRGRLRGEAMMDSAYQMLRWGTLAVGIGLVLVLMAAPEEAVIRDRMSAAVIIFFAAALSGIAIARLRLEGIRSGSPLGPRWLATFAAPIASILLLAVIAAAIFSRRFLDTMLLILSPFIWAIGLIVRLIVILVALLAFIIIAPLLWLLEREGFGQMSGGLRIPVLFRSFDGFQQFALTRLNVADPLRYLVVGLILFGIISGLTRFVYRRRRHWRDTALEQRESVMSLGEAVGSFSFNLRRFFRPLHREDSLARLRGDPRWAHTVFIRETYRRMQRWGAKGGVEQGLSTTAIEYEPDLAGRFPDAGPAIRTIIAAYTLARYSGVPASADDAASVRQAWETLRRLKVS
jgi:hypothetical protein